MIDVDGHHSIGVRYNGFNDIHDKSSDVEGNISFLDFHKLD